MRTIKRAAALLGGFFIIAFAYTNAFAMDESVKERKALMKTIGGSIGLTVKMVKGAIPFDADKAEKALKTIAETSDKLLPLFKEGTDMTKVKESEASPKIWKDLEDFKSKIEAMKVASLKSAEAAKKGKGALAGTLRALGGSCASCHTAYRVKKQK